MKESIRAVTFNIAGGNRIGKNSWYRRKEVNIQVLKRINPDIIGFQELHTDNLDDYQSNFPNFEFSLGFDEGNGMFPNTFAWNRDKFELIGSGGFWLSETPDIMSKGWDSHIPRACSWIQLNYSTSNRELLVLNTHLDFEGSIARIQGVTQILMFLRNYQDLPTLILGDFNCSPNCSGGKKLPCPPYDLILDNGFVDVWQEANPNLPPRNTYHNFEGDKYRLDQYQAWNVDWIMAKGFKIIESEVITDSQKNLYPSDHYPVLAVLLFR